MEQQTALSIRHQHRVERCVQRQASITEQATINFEWRELRQESAAGHKMIDFNSVLARVESNGFSGRDVGSYNANVNVTTVKSAEVDQLRKALPNGFMSYRL
jgi:hypothetical protein